MTWETYKEPERSNLVESYAQLILDGMDYKTLEQFAYDCLVQNLTEDYDDDQELAKEILECYDQETLDDLMGASSVNQIMGVLHSTTWCSCFSQHFQ